MTRRFWLLLAIGVALGCRSTFELVPLTAEHPASPQARETAAPPVTAVLPASESYGAALSGQDTPTDAAGQTYVCPMHPEVRQAEPGRCPQCGMQLVPQAPEENAPHPGHVHAAAPPVPAEPPAPASESAATHEHEHAEEGGAEGAAAQHEHAAESESGDEGSGHEQPSPSGHHRESADHEHESDEGSSHQARPDGQDAGHHHGQEAEPKHGIARLVAWLGKFHPMVVHFPIALALGAVVAEFLRLPSAARFCLWAAAVTGIGAAALGWAHAWGGAFGPDVAVTIERHRWFGTATAGWLTLTAVIAEAGARRGQAAPRRGPRLLLLSAAVLVAVTGHLGAVITHGPDYAAW